MRCILIGATGGAITGMSLNGHFSSSFVFQVNYHHSAQHFEGILSKEIGF